MQNQLRRAGSGRRRAVEGGTGPSVNRPPFSEEVESDLFAATSASIMKRSRPRLPEVGEPPVPARISRRSGPSILDRGARMDRDWVAMASGRGDRPLPDCPRSGSRSTTGTRSACSIEDAASVHRCGAPRQPLPKWRRRSDSWAPFVQSLSICGRIRPGSRVLCGYACAAGQTPIRGAATQACEANALGPVRIAGLRREGGVQSGWRPCEATRPV